ncbi:MAG: glycosyltransferase family 1 protein [Candidatus Moraniibacteriota bacterium]
MKIAIDASRAFLNQRTGIEEYAFETIKNLRKNLKCQEVVLYLRIGGKKRLEESIDLPSGWVAKEISFKYFWTQIGMAWEFLTNPPDVLFIPAHTVPWIHPQNTVVTVHGLEYEHCPESYSLYSRLFHRFFIRKSCLWARKIIAVSHNTKKDLIERYGVPEEKIKVVYNGFNSPVAAPKEQKKENVKKNGEKKDNYFLYIGRLEKRKNIEGIIKAFEIAKKEKGYKGKLLLAGKPGYGYEDIKKAVVESEYCQDITELGYIEQERKWQLLEEADVFLFPSLCEGFGLPILEAQTSSVPVVTSNFGPMDEVVNNSDLLADPLSPEEIANLAVKLTENKVFRQKVIKKGRENIENFSWASCGKETASVLVKNAGKDI